MFFFLNLEKKEAKKTQLLTGIKIVKRRVHTNSMFNMSIDTVDGHYCSTRKLLVCRVLISTPENG